MAETQETPETSQAARPRRLMDIPEIRRVRITAGPEALLLGIRDFRAAPLYGLAVGALYALGGWLIAWLLYAFALPFLAYPTAMGFALIAPFAAAGTYEVSRRLETGQPLSWSAVLGTVWQQSGRDMGWMALVTGFAFFIWVDWAGIVFLLFFGLDQLQLDAFLDAVFNSWEGLYFLLLGHFAGAVMSVIVFSLTVISFPLLVDREIDFVTAMTTSVRAVAANPLPMALWAALIGVLLASAIFTFFVALPVVLPVLGHASWHFYRSVIGSAVQREAERA